MECFRLTWDANHHRNLTLKDEEEWDFFNDLDGRSLADVREVQVEFLDAPRRTMPEVDFPPFASHVPVFTPRAKEALQDLTGDAGQ